MDREETGGEVKILVTGASGFVGSAFIRRALATTDHTLVGLARNSDQRNLRRLNYNEAVTHAVNKGRLRLLFGDLNGDLSGITEGVDAVVNFAARTFVDHSIRDVGPFVMANVVGAMNLLEDARRQGVRRFIQISTDEVYGAILEGAYTETAPINPTNPYAASKAGADALALSYAHTFGMHTTVTRTENNAGPWQHPQKVFPVFVKKTLAGENLPVYGDGLHVRQWLYVDDHVDAVLLLLTKDYPPGEVFHVAGQQELTNIDLARAILRHLDVNDTDARITYIPDHNIRPGHDRRYALDCTKLRGLGWAPKVDLISLVRQTVHWYATNRWWLE